MSAIQWRSGLPAHEQMLFRHIETIQVAVLGLAITVALSFLTLESENHERSALFNRVTEINAERVRDQITRIQADTRAIGRFYESDERVDRREFQTFVAPMTMETPIQAFEWIPRVPAAMKKQFEGQASRDGYRGFSIWARNAHGQKVAAAGRADYYPVYYVEPMEGNGAVLGFDLGSETVRRAALEQAARTRLMTGTSPITLVQEKERQHGMLIFQPVYAGDKNGKNILRGFSLGVVRPQALLERTVGLMNRGDEPVELHLLDLMAPDGPKLIAVYPKENAEAHPEVVDKAYLKQFRLTSIRPVFAFGRAYAVVAHPTSDFYAKHPTKNSLAVGVAGLLLTIVMTILAAFLRNRHALLERQVRERTEELRQSEENLSITLRSIGDGVIATDTKERITRMNPVAEALTGWTIQEAAGKRFSDVFRLINALTKEAAQNPITKALITGEVVGIESHAALVARDGVERQIADSAAPITDPEGRIVGAVLVFHDVTAEYLVKQSLSESEERFRTVVSAARDAILVMGSGGEVVLWNSAAEAMFGWTAEEAMGRLVHRLVSPQTIATHGKALPIFQASSEVAPVGKTVELAALHKDGHEFPVELSLAPLTLDGGWGAVGVIRDITERKRAEEKIQILARFPEENPDPVLRIAAKGTVLYANKPGKALLAKLSSAVGSLAPQTWRDWAAQSMAANTTETVNVEYDGRIYTFSLVPIKQGGYVNLYARDITEQKRAEQALQEEERRYRSLWESANEGFCLHELVTDASGQAVDYRILEVNPAYERITGLKADDVLGRLASQVYVTGDAPYLDIYARVASTGVSENFEAYLAQLDRHFSVSVFSPSPGLFATALSDISERKAHEEVLSHQATHDSLTGLPNRESFEGHLRERTESAAGQKRNVFDLMFMDLDKFKLINDALGHKVGDLLLVAVADRLRSCLRPNDVLARMGGDEFTIILQSAGRRSRTESVAARIIDSISRPFEIEGHKLVIGVSFGLAAYPSDGTDSVTLLKHADSAMYKAKEAGRGTFRWFTGEAEAENRLRANMERDLRRALEDNRLEVHYQPVVRLDDGSLHGAEALLRWKHDEKWMMSPSLFIPIAEEIGLIGSIGDYVLRAACSQTMAWRDEGMQLSQIGVNVSTVQIRDTSWLDSVKAAISDSGLDPRHLVLELTESDFAADYQSLRASLREVQQLGIGISIDDFGMGQSSLSRLKDFAVIELKIDGSFVRDIEHVENDKALLNSIIQMAHDQGIKVTAEWVETEAQADILRSSGCDFAQGYFFSPPLPADEFRAFALNQMPSAKRKRRAA